MCVCIHTARIRPIGYGLGIEETRRGKRNLNYRVCPINTRIISANEREKEKSKSQRRKRKERTDHNCFIIEVLLYSTYHNNNNNNKHENGTCVSMCARSLSLINIADIDRSIHTSTQSSTCECAFFADSMPTSVRRNMDRYFNDLSNHSPSIRCHDRMHVSHVDSVNAVPTVVERCVSSRLR